MYRRTGVDTHSPGARWRLLNAGFEIEADSRSAVVQHYVELGRVAEGVIDDLENRIGVKKDRIDDLGEQLAKRSQIEELPDKIRDEQTYQEHPQALNLSTHSRCSKLSSIRPPLR